MSRFYEYFEEITDCSDLSSGDDSECSDVEGSGPYSSDLLTRVPRSTRPGPQRQGRAKQHHRAVSYTKILMPTGKFHNIRDLVDPKWHCGWKTKLVNLRPKHREFKMVERQMQSTIVEDKNCSSTGGCFVKYNIVKIQKVLQGCAWRRYLLRKQDIELVSGKANERMLFHGTDAVWNVVKSGFDERFASTNGSFGAGLYFTQHSSISNKFVYGYFGGNGCEKHQDKNCYICERHLFLSRVTLGSEHKLENTQNMAHPPPGFDSVSTVPRKNGFDYPEYVIYRGEQAYPDYLITYKIVKESSVTENQADNEDDSGEGARSIDVRKFKRRGGDRERQ